MATSEPSLNTQIALSTTMMKSYGLAAEMAFEVLMAASNLQMPVEVDFVLGEIRPVDSGDDVRGIAVSLMNESGTLYFIEDVRGASWVIEGCAGDRHEFPCRLTAGQDRHVLVDRCIDFLCHTHGNGDVTRHQ